MPFTGKKLVPAKLRRDYWRPFAMLAFERAGNRAAAQVISKSVMQKLREFRIRHEVQWESQELKKLRRESKKRELGMALNDQRANCVADLAAVLAGAGGGNHIVQSKSTTPEESSGKSEEEGKNNKPAVDDDGAAIVKVFKPEKKGWWALRRATIFWHNEQDHHYAEEWTDNVKHVLGLPSDVGVRPWPTLAIAPQGEGMTPIEQHLAAEAERQAHNYARRQAERQQEARQAKLNRLDEIRQELKRREDLQIRREDKIRTKEEKRAAYIARLGEEGIRKQPALLPRAKMAPPSDDAVVEKLLAEENALVEALAEEERMAMEDDAVEVATEETAAEEKGDDGDENQPGTDSKWPK
jgi:hypothetical protein